MWLLSRYERILWRLFYVRLCKWKKTSSHVFTYRKQNNNISQEKFQNLYVYLWRTGSQTILWGSCFIQFRKFRASMNSWSPAFSKHDLTLGSMLVPPKAWASPSTLGTYLNKYLKIKSKLQSLIQYLYTITKQESQFSLVWFSGLVRNQTKHV